jgi:hypothetical protein
MKIEDIKTGMSCVSSSNLPLGKSIQKFQSIHDKEFGKYNHAMMFAWCGKELYVIEAMGKKIVSNKFNEKYLKNDDIAELMVLIPKVEIEPLKMFETLTPYIGVSQYDYFNLIIAQPIEILTHGRLWLGEETEDYKDFICSEFVAAMYNLYFEKNLFDDPQKLSPSNLCHKDFFSHEKIK